MRSLGRPIGLGLAARGDIEEVVGWARQARDQGLDSVWVHDSYFERDGVSFATAIAQAIAVDDDGDEAGFRVALGAANPFTRHPGRPRDDRLRARRDPARADRAGPRDRAAAAPQADGHPVRAGRRGRGRVRPRWTRSGRCGPASALPSATPGLPPIQPMFPPTHRIPIVIAAYRTGVRRAGRPEGRRLPRPARPSRSRRCAGSSSGCGRRPRPPGATRRRSRRPATCCRSSTRRGARRSTGPSASRS